MPTDPGDPRADFDRFAADRRRLELPGYLRADLPFATRYTPDKVDGEGIIVFTRLPDGAEAAIIDDQIRYFDDLGVAFEWKTYTLDHPADLKARLAARGFIADDDEGFLLLSTRQMPPERDVAGYEIRRLTAHDDLDAIATVQAGVWGRPFDWLIEELDRSRLQDPAALSIYCAFQEGEPVATAWTAFHADSAYPEFHGGGVLPAHRGRGLYAKLIRRRLSDLTQRGYDFAAVDASPMSRPILEAIGARFICWTTPMRWPG